MQALREAQLPIGVDNRQTPRRKAMFAAAVGNILEGYDFSVYAFFAGVIGQTFFPATDPTASLLASFGVFGAGFLMRPLGGIVIGRLGDRLGRKAALMITIACMAIGTLLIGVLPGYGSIGLAAPALLMVARLIQGFAFGGEWGSAAAFMVEWAPAGQRGWYGSLQQATVQFSLILGSGTAALLTTVLSPDDFAAWGWRVPFLLGSFVALVGLYMRKNVDETPAYRSAAAQTASSATSTLRPALQAFGLTIQWGVAGYTFFVFLPSFTQTQGGLTSAQSLWSNTLSVLALVLTIPLFGALSDRLGRKPFLLACSIGFIILPVPMFKLITGQPGFAAIAAMQVLIAVCYAPLSGVGPAVLCELFKTLGRSTWMTTAYAFSIAIFAGFAPFIATWLIATTGSPLSPAYYVIAAAAVSNLVIWGMPETAHRDLE